MTLSEGEQRRLDEIERALKSDDPNFGTTITISQFRRHRAIVAGTVFVLGMVALVTGLVVADAALWFGIAITLAGCALMVLAAVMFFRGRSG